MFYWPKFMLEVSGVEQRLLALNSTKRIAFAAACARHAISQFETMRSAGMLSFSQPGVLQSLLSIIDDIWMAMAWSDVGQTIADYDARLKAIAPSDYKLIMGYNEGEMLNATDQVLMCLQEGGSCRRAILAAKNAYHAVSKWHVAKQFPGRAMSAAEIISFESESPDCKQELKFQLATLTYLERVRELPPACQDLIDSSTNTSSIVTIR